MELKVKNEAEKTMLIAVMIPIRSFETNIGLETALPKDIYGYIPIYKSMEAARKAFPDLDINRFNVVELCDNKGVYNDGVIHTCRNSTSLSSQRPSPKRKG